MIQLSQPTAHATIEPRSALVMWMLPFMSLTVYPCVHNYVHHTFILSPFSPISRTQLSPSILDCKHNDSVCQFWHYSIIQINSNCLMSIKLNCWLFSQAYIGLLWIFTIHIIKQYFKTHWNLKLIFELKCWLNDTRPTLHDYLNLYTVYSVLVKQIT